MPKYTLRPEAHLICLWAGDNAAEVASELELDETLVQVQEDGSLTLALPPKPVRVLVGQFAYRFGGRVSALDNLDRFQDLAPEGPYAFLIS